MIGKWEPCAAGEAVIAHISDLHLGVDLEVDAVWEETLRFLRETVKPDLVVVSGDLVDTPNEGYYRQAKRDLDAAFADRYYVCAGNHDRHPRGLKPLKLVSRVFGKDHTNLLLDSIFETRLLRSKPATVRTIGTISNSWKIGLAGIDTSIRADRLARGYADPAYFSEIEGAAAGQDWDLGIFAVHHHLLSIRSLEASRRNKLRDLLKVLCLVNSGTLLEVLARSWFDLALHGHEHKHNTAAYGSLEGARGNIRIIGAASATGNETGHGASLDRAGLNLIILSRQRTGTLQQLEFADGTWCVKGESHLFDAAELRNSWLRRKYKLSRPQVSAQIIKYTEYTRDRDIIVRWLFHKWVLGEKFIRPVSSWSGYFDESSLKTAIHTSSGVNVDVDAKLVRSPTGVGSTHTIEFEVPKELHGVVATVEISFRWASAAILTQAELQAAAADKTAVAPLLTEKLQFSAIVAPEPVSLMELVLIIPPEFAPEKLQVHVSEEIAKIKLEEGSAELQDNLRKIAAGVYSFRIEYPRPGQTYILAWEPVVGQLSDQAIAGIQSFAEFAKIGIQVLQDSLARTGFPQACTTVALYSPSKQNMMLDRIAFRKPEFLMMDPPEAVDITEQSAVAQAWYGVPWSASHRPADARRAMKIGFNGSEQILIAIPIRFGMNWTNPSPIAVARIAVSPTDAKDLTCIANDVMIWSSVFSAATAMLSRFYEVTYERRRAATDDQN